MKNTLTNIWGKWKKVYSQCQLVFTFITNRFYLKDKNIGKNVRSNDQPTGLSWIIKDCTKFKEQMETVLETHHAVVKLFSKSRHLVLHEEKTELHGIKHHRSINSLCWFKNCAGLPVNWQTVGLTRYHLFTTLQLLDRSNIICCLLANLKKPTSWHKHRLIHSS